MIHSPLSPSLVRRSAVILALWCSLTWGVRAEIEDMAVIAVTDMTPAGRQLPPVSRENPVYYQAVTAGYQDFGRGIAGEREPDNDAFLQVVLRTLKKQGYIPATDEHPATIVLGFSWGSLRGDMAGALNVLGGNKLDLMWEVRPTTGLDVRQWLRGLRSEKADRVLELAKGDLFVMNIAAYDRDALIRGKQVALWNTRISSPTRGVWAADALPRIVEVGGPVIGRETETPELTTVREAFGKEGSVEIGDLAVVDEAFDLNTVPLLDMTKEKDSKND